MEQPVVIHPISPKLLFVAAAPMQPRVRLLCSLVMGGSVAEWLVCWTRTQKGLGSVAATTLSGNSLKQAVHTHRASVHQAAKLVAALLRVAGVTVGLAQSNGSLPPGL